MTTDRGKSGPRRLSRRGLIGAGAATAAVGGLWLAGLRPGPGDAAPVLSAPEAHALARDGDLTLIDIRRPDEWAATGIPEPAVAIDMRARDFIDRLDQATGGDRAAPVAVICARGVRSRRLAARLAEAGYGDVRDVSEGMLGSGAGPGWLARDLPVRTP